MVSEMLFLRLYAMEILAFLQTGCRMPNILSLFSTNCVFDIAYEHERTDVLRWLMTHDDLTVTTTSSQWLIWTLCDTNQDWHLLSEL